MGGPSATGKSKHLQGQTAALTGTRPCQTGPKVIEPTQGAFRLELSILHRGKAASVWLDLERMFQEQFSAVLLGRPDISR